MVFHVFQFLKGLELMSEAKLQTKILKYLKLEGYWVIKTILCNRNGIMDIIACSPRGRFVGIEVKWGNGKPSKLQEYNIAEVTKRNGVAFIAWDLETVVKNLEYV